MLLQVGPGQSSGKEVGAVEGEGFIKQTLNTLKATRSRWEGRVLTLRRPESKPVGELFPPLHSKREGKGFSSLMKQKKKAKNYAVFCFAGKKKLLFYIYDVIVKQNFNERFRLYYSRL